MNSEQPMPDTRHTLHMIGHAHIDPVWLWRWPEGFAETKATFRSALDRMKEFPDFIFTASAAAHYEWIEHSDPAMFREIKRRVKEGRWEPTGGWWVEADVNIPNGESLIRQALHGQRYFREKLGVTSRVAFSPDTFGHSAQLPKILAGCGYEAYLFMRPSDTEDPGVPMPVFKWLADDGSSVICFRIVWSYNANSVAALENKHKRLPEIVANSPFHDHMFCFYGVGNHGGGPTIELLKTIKKWQKDPKRHRLVFSSLEKFLDLAKTRVDQLPEHRREMQGHALGCLSVVSEVKAMNRRAEETLGTAEAWSVAAQAWTKRRPNRVRMDRAWKDALFNQFHDILPGSSVGEAYIDARDQVGGAIHAAACELTESIAEIAANVDTRGEGAPLFVFNSLPFPFEGVIETEDIGFGLGNDDTLRLTDAKGKDVPHQRVPAHTVCQRVRMVARVKVPAMGYVFLRQPRVVGGLREGSAKPQVEDSPGRTGLVHAGRNEVENEMLRVSLSEDGYLRVTELRSGNDVFAREGGAVARVLEDKSDTWSHGVAKFENVIGKFTLECADVIESGPVRGKLRARYRYGESTLRLDFTLGAGEAFVGVDARVDWREKWKMLKLAFPTGLAAETTTAEVPYGTAIHPADSTERPMQQWLDIAGKDRGVAIANNSVGSSRVDLQACKLEYSIVSPK